MKALFNTTSLGEQKRGKIAHSILAGVGEVVLRVAGGSRRGKCGSLDANDYIEEEATSWI